MTNDEERDAHTSTRAPLDLPRPPTADYVRSVRTGARSLAVTAERIVSTAVSTAGTTAVALARGGVALARVADRRDRDVRASSRRFAAPRATRATRATTRGRGGWTRGGRALFRRFEEAPSQGNGFC